MDIFLVCGICCLFRVVSILEPLELKSSWEHYYFYIKQAIIYPHIDNRQHIDNIIIRNSTIQDLNVIPLSECIEETKVALQKHAKTLLFSRNVQSDSYSYLFSVKD